MYVACCIEGTFTLLCERCMRVELHTGDREVLMSHIVHEKVQLSVASYKGWRETPMAYENVWTQADASYGLLQ